MTANILSFKYSQFAPALFLLLNTPVVTYKYLVNIFIKNNSFFQLWWLQSLDFCRLLQKANLSIMINKLLLWFDKILFFTIQNFKIYLLGHILKDLLYSHTYFNIKEYCPTYLRFTRFFLGFFMSRGRLQTCVYRKKIWLMWQNVKTNYFLN